MQRASPGHRPLAFLTGARGCTAAFAAAVGLATVIADPALAGSLPGAERMTQRELRQAERRLFGSEHAAEHAATRRVARAERRRWKRMSAFERRRARRPVARVSAGDPATDGRWTPAFDMPVVAVHSAVLPTGKVMIFSQTLHDYRQRAAAAYLWDPAKRPGEPGEFEAVPPGDNIWCGGQSLMADGQLLVTGGNLNYATSTSGFAGLKSVFTFDPWTKRWTRQPDMNRGRWYPTQTLLPDGRTLISSGYDENAGYDWNRDMDVFVPAAARGGVGAVQTIARYGELAGAPANPHWYPHWFVMPSGKVLNAGFTRAQSFLLDPAPGAVRAHDRPDWSVTRKYGSAVLMPGSATGSQRVMMLGGYDSSNRATEPDFPSLSSTEVFDESTPATPARPGPLMRVPRQSQNTVLLPDSSLVNIGGGSGEMTTLRAQSNGYEGLAVAGPEHRAIEILDPGSDTWRLGPSQAYKRAYHSTAVLLPDGRVLSAGDDRDPQRPDYQRVDRAEIYEPAYLFKPGPRPQITRAPDAVGYDQDFSITTSVPIADAVLMAPGAVTHANNMSQRLVRLRVQPRADGTGADLVAPPDANVAPPGYYMLFALSANGKPSVAQWVHIGAAGTGAAGSPTEPGAPPAAPEPPAPVTTPPSPVNPPATPATTQPDVPAAPRPARPVTPAAPVATDTAAPRTSVRSTTRGRLLRRDGRLTLSVAANEAATARLYVGLPGRDGRTVRAPRRGSVTLRLSAGRARAVTLVLARSERRRLAAGTLHATVRIAARDAAGNAWARTVRLRLAR